MSPVTASVAASSNAPSNYDLTYVYSRSEKFAELSTIMVNGTPIPKLDYLGAISIQGHTYFNVFRRFNNVYEILFEDYHGEVHFHKDYSVFQSIQRLLCLSDDQMRGLYVMSAFSLKHSGSPAISDEFMDMRWSAIQGNYHGLIMNLGGILDYPATSATTHAQGSQGAPSLLEENSRFIEEHAQMVEERFQNQDEVIDYCLRTVNKCNEEIQELRREFETPVPTNTIHYPDAPEKALRCIPYCCTDGTNGAKRQRLTDRFEEEVEEDSDEWEVECIPSEHEEEAFPHSDSETYGTSEEEESEEEEEEEEEEEDYLELRSGMKYYK